MSMRTVGLVAEFRNPAEILAAATTLRDAGYKKFDCHSPFPIHGMDRAMGLKRSPLGWIVGLFGFGGAGLGMLMQWWMSAVDYPLVIAGKPFFSYQAFVPITFGVAVLLGAISTVVGMLTLSRLPMFHHKVFHSDRFTRVTNDGFFVSVDAGDSKFDADITRSMLESAGGINIELLEETDQ
jgi:hypothetical protein